MAFNKNGNITKASFTADIKRKQSLYNRFKRRYHVSNNSAEKKFLKNEATRLVTELRQWSKKWQTWGFGGYNWITKDFTVTNFNNYKGYKSYRKPVAARTTGGTRKSPTTKSYGRKSTRSTARRTTNRSNVRRTSRTRSYAARKNYSAW